MTYTTREIERIINLSQRQLRRRNLWSCGIWWQLVIEYHVLFVIHSMVLVLTPLVAVELAGKGELNWWSLLVTVLMITGSAQLFFWVWYVIRQRNNHAVLYLKRLRQRTMWYDGVRRQWEARHVQRDIARLEALKDRFRFTSEVDRRATTAFLTESIVALQAESDTLAARFAHRIAELEYRATVKEVTPSTHVPQEGSLAVWESSPNEGQLACVEPVVDSTSEAATQEEEGAIARNRAN